MRVTESPALYNSILDYIYVILQVAGATAILLVFRPTISTSTVALVYLLPVVISSALWGLGPGMISGVLGFLSFNFFFLLPYYTLTVHQPQDLLALVVFLIVAVLISQLAGREKRMMADSQKREGELSHFYELSTNLSGVNQPADIARVLVNKLADMFQPEFAVVHYQPQHGDLVIDANYPTTDQLPELRPTIVVPLQTVRGFQGEIRLWMGEEKLSPEEDRLLRTFAAQGAMALERAALQQADTRARILEESDRLKTALLNSVSHELRTPLATIKASTTSLISGEVEWDTEARQELLFTIDEETDQLNRTVGNLLDMSRLEAGALKPDQEWNDLEDILNSALGRMRRPLEAYQLELKIPDSMPLVAVDFMQIERVLTNLISNSIKYSQPGSQIQITAGVQDASWAWVQVSNQGPPVPAEYLEHIFDKFVRITDAERVPGTGLGLSICAGIIEAHGGRIWAENLPGRFAFNFTLPLTLDGRLPAEIKLEPE